MKFSDLCRHQPNRRIRVQPPIGEQKRYPTLTLTVIHAEDRGTPKNRKRIDWMLITDLPAQARKDAIAKLEWYSLRRKIEVFHKVLKADCRAEEAKLGPPSAWPIWHVFWMMMLNRSRPDTPLALALTDAEIVLLDRLVKERDQRSRRRRTLSHYLIKITRFGGYLARVNDPPPGNMWRGLSRLTDIELGAVVGAGNVGKLKASPDAYRQ